MDVDRIVRQAAEAVERSLGPALELKLAALSQKFTERELQAAQALQAERRDAEARASHMQERLHEAGPLMSCALCLFSPLLSFVLLGFAPARLSSNFSTLLFLAVSVVFRLLCSVHPSPHALLLSLYVLYLSGPASAGTVQEAAGKYSY